MATATSDALGAAANAHRLNVTRIALATGITAGVIFVFCWLGTFVPFSSPTYAYITLFTSAAISSGWALVEGTCWSLLFGLIVGAVFALIYNATAAFMRR